MRDDNHEEEEEADDDDDFHSDERESDSVFVVVGVGFGGGFGLPVHCCKDCFIKSKDDKRILKFISIYPFFLSRIAANGEQQ